MPPTEAAPAATTLRRRVAVIDQWSRALIDQAESLCQRWSDHYEIDRHALLHYELAGLAAALEELVECAESELVPERNRRWFSGETIRFRAEPIDAIRLRVDSGRLPAAPLALAACAFVAGCAVTLSVAPADRAVFEAALACAERESVDRAISLEDDDSPADAHGLDRSLLGAERPAIAWLDAPELLRDLEGLCEKLERAAKYGGGARSGALRWIAAKPSVVDGMFARKSPWASAADSAGVVRDVKIVRGAFGAEHETVEAPTLVVESFESERAWVERALQFERFSATATFGRDKDRLRSLAARTRPRTIFINSTPACALGGLLRAEFDARRWLREVSRAVPVVHGAPPSVAAVSESSARRRWLRGWLRATLGRYGLGGRIEDLW